MKKVLLLALLLIVGCAELPVNNGEEQIETKYAFILTHSQTVHVEIVPDSSKHPFYPPLNIDQCRGVQIVIV